MLLVDLFSSTTRQDIAEYAVMGGANFCYCGRNDSLSGSNSNNRVLEVASSNRVDCRWCPGSAGLRLWDAFGGGSFSYGDLRAFLFFSP
jgi:hypothetical protein